MRNFQKTGRWKQMLQSKLALGVLAILVLFFAYNMIGFWGKMRDTAKNKDIAQNKIIELEASKEKLSTDIQKLSTPMGQEETIRDKFGLVKEGEGLIVVVDDKNATANASAAKTGGFFSFFTNLFK